VQARKAAAGDSEALITRERLEEWSQRFHVPAEAELRLFDAPED
jgi:hypothetical protein